MQYAIFIGDEIIEIKSRPTLESRYTTYTYVVRVARTYTYVVRVARVVVCQGGLCLEFRSYNDSRCCLDF
jgi:hypothetical protein